MGKENANAGILLENTKHYSVKAQIQNIKSFITPSHLELVLLTLGKRPMNTNHNTQTI